jgi:uridine kinase
MEKLMNEIIKILDFQNNILIGIDGLGGSGKSTLADSLKLKLENKNHNVFVFHIDDFIYPRKIRYNDSKEEWYCYYNLQWRYDYLIDEVLKPFKQGVIINKQIELYDKENDIYRFEQITIPQGSIILLEGIFLQRKEMRQYLDYVIYLEVPNDIRMERVLNRDIYIGNTEDIKSKYENRYFPAQDKYMEEYSPKESSDYILIYIDKDKIHD